MEAIEEVKKARDEFNQLIKVNGKNNLGYNTDRLNYDKNDLENALSKHWAEENKVRTYVNFGRGLLQDLFMKDGRFLIYRSFPLLWITRRDRLIVATVIQWLGTNCGLCFLQEALDKAGYKIVKK